MIAFRRDLVVLDCQPPSNTRTKSSPTSAILLPCRNTTDTPSMFSTRVFACPQSRDAEMASFISRSILRIGGIRLNKCTIQEMREGTTDCVPLPQVSLTKEGEVSIQDKIDDLIRGIAIEAITEPIQCHLGGCHGVAHVPLQFEQVVVVESECFCHAPIISMGFGRSLASV